MILPMNLVEAASLSGDTLPGPNAWSVSFVVIVEGEDQDLCQQSRGRPWLINTTNGRVKRGVHQKIIGTKPDHLKKAWKSNCKDAKWTEVTRDLEYLQEVIYDKNTTWHKSMKETLRQDNDRFGYNGKRC